MNIKINLAEDKELRNHIKNMIRGQVLSIAREEFVKILQEELARKVKGFEDKTFDKFMSECGMKAIENILRDDHNVSEWNTSFIEPFVNHAIEKTLSRKDWTKVIDDAVKVKISKLL